MDKTFLHSKPHISQYASFLMNHFLQMTVFEGSKLNWKRKFFIKKFIFIFTPVISFYVTLHIACAQTSSVFYSYMGSISLLFVLHHVLFSYTYLFCISYGTLCPVQSYCYLCAAGKDWKQLKLWERWYLLRIICQPFLFLGISNTPSGYFFFLSRQFFMGFDLMKWDLGAS